MSSVFPNFSKYIHSPIYGSTLYSKTNPSTSLTTLSPLHLDIDQPPHRGEINRDHYTAFLRTQFDHQVTEFIRNAKVDLTSQRKRYKFIKAALKARYKFITAALTDKLKKQKIQLQNTQFAPEAMAVFQTNGKIDTNALRQLVENGQLHSSALGIALILATQQGSTKNVRTLLTAINQLAPEERAIALNQEDDVQGQTALILAAQQGSTKNVKALLTAINQLAPEDIKADIINHQDRDGRTALIAAAQKNHNDVIDLLLKQAPGINIDISDIKRCKASRYIGLHKLAKQMISFSGIFRSVFNVR
jgi:hypothetical protein